MIEFKNKKKKNIKLGNKVIVDYILLWLKYFKYQYQYNNNDNVNRSEWQLGTLLRNNIY